MAYQTNKIKGSGYGNPYLDSLIWGDGWIGSEITYSFNSGSTSHPLLGSFEGKSWTPTETSAVADILLSYSAVCNLSFTRATDNSTTSNMALWSVSSSYMGTNLLGIFLNPDGTYPQISGGFNYDGIGYSDLKKGGFGYLTFLHEFGHALGLAHPHDGGSNPDATKFPGVVGPFSTGTYNLNQAMWTVMSYNNDLNQGKSTDTSFGYQSTPMAFDIAALQAIYGANTSYNSGDNTYTLANINQFGTNWSCIWDVGGNDTITNQGSSKDCNIDLREASLVGENGPELFIPRTAGTVVPNGQFASAMGGGGQTVNYNGPYIASMSAIDTQSATQFLAKNKQTIWAVNQSAQRSLPVSK
jgi:serralysin